MAESSKRTFRHFTDEEGLKGILKDGMILEATDTLNDAALGIGVYVNRMDPDKHSKTSIAKNNYDGVWENKKEKVNYAIEMKLPARNVELMDGPRDVGVHRGPIDLNKVEHKVRRVPDTKRK